MKGCYVFFEDKNVKKYFLSRLAIQPKAQSLDFGKYDLSPILN